MRTGKVVLGTLAGLAIGAMAGILFAPESGSKTRKKIMNKGDGYVDEFKSKFDKFLDSLTEKFESTKKEAHELTERGKAKFEEVKKEARYSASDGKPHVS
jgi:gas vesicle protein